MTWSPSFSCIIRKLLSEISTVSAQTLPRMSHLTKKPAEQRPSLHPPSSLPYHLVSLLCHCKTSQCYTRLKSCKVKVPVAQLCLTLCDLVDYCQPGSSVHGILQARKLESIAIPFSRRSSQPRDPTLVSCIAEILYCLSHHGSPNIHS